MAESQSCLEVPELPSETEQEFFTKSHEPKFIPETFVVSALISLAFPPSPQITYNLEEIPLKPPRAGDEADLETRETLGIKNVLVGLGWAVGQGCSRDSGWGRREREACAGALDVPARGSCSVVACETQLIEPC